MKNLRFKKIFVTPILWMYVGALVIDAALKYIFKEQYNVGFSFLLSIVYVLIDYCVAVKLREVLGFGPISYSRAIGIGVVSSLKLCCIPLIFIIFTFFLVSTQAFFRINIFNDASFGKEYLWSSLIVTIAFSWIIVGVNYALFTNNTSNLTVRTFSIIKSMPKKIGQVLISYIALIIVGELSMKVAVLDILVNIVVLLIVSVFLRSWLYEIFFVHQKTIANDELAEVEPVI